MQTKFARDVLDHLSTAVLMFDAEMRLTAINPAGEMLFDVSAKKVLSRPLAELIPRGERIERILERTLTSRHPVTAWGVPIELPGRRYLTLDCIVTPLLDGSARGGAQARAPALLVEMIQVDRLLRLAREDSLLARHAASRAVIRGLAHEIKNPLGGLRGAAQLLERELPSAALKEYTGIIMHEADRLRDLVDRMLGPYQLGQKTQLNIHAVLEHVRLLIQAEASEGLSIERDYDPSLPDIEGDSGQLVQATLNIVRNAVQALNGQGRIRLRTRVENGFVIGHRHHRLVLRAEIEDNGPGIPPELIERIFYPMVTGRADGSGLGLSIAQDIITRHGGLIECDSHPGRTVFTLYLPLSENNHG